MAAGSAILSAANWILVYTSFREMRAPGQTVLERRAYHLTSLFRRVDLPGVGRANLLWFLYLLAFSGMEFTLTFLAAERFGYAPRQISYLFVFAGLIMVIVQGGLIRRMAPLYGERRLVLAGLLLVIPGFVLTGLASREGGLYLGLGLMSVGSALLSPATTALVSLYTGPDRQGYALGIFRSLGALARAVGPLAACAVYWSGGPTAPYLAGAALVVVPLVIAFGLPEPERP